MKRPRKPRDIELARTAPLPEGHFHGPDGREYVSVPTANGRFAAACLRAMTLDDGRPRGAWMLRAMNHIDVPAGVLPMARVFANASAPRSGETANRFGDPVPTAPSGGHSE